MAIKINLGVSKKLGLPDYGSAGASCNLELEIDPRLLESDLAGFHDRVRSGVRPRPSRPSRTSSSDSRALRLSSLLTTTAGAWRTATSPPP